MDVNKVAVDKTSIKKSAKKISDNDLIAEYYEKLAEENESDLLQNRAANVKGCFKLWDLDYYRKQKIKDIKRINLCKDKFCLNCQNIASKRRYMKYKPLLDDLENNADIYHVVFTVPNCFAEDLKNTLETMYRKFPYVTQYFQCKRKCKGIDFKKYGFFGAVRSLEITTKKEKSRQTEYHPHFHCLFVLRKGLKEKRRHVNEYSFNGKYLTRRFTDLEILLQKIWYLFMNGEKLTVEKVRALKQGYSVTADKANGNYKEVFKYAVKGSFKDGAIFNYKVFETLHKALHRRKIIQGYGRLNHIDFEDEITAEEVDEIYEAIRRELQKTEDPERQYMSLKEIFSDFEENADIRYISKNAIRHTLKEEK